MLKKIPFKLVVPSVVLILVLMLNIILICQPVFMGKYSCYDKKQKTYHEISFYDNTFDYYKKIEYRTGSTGEVEIKEGTIYGFYLYNKNNSTLYLDVGEFSSHSGISDEICKRKSVFSFSISTAAGLFYEDKYEIEFNCSVAIFLQVFYVCVMVGCLGYLILLYLKYKKSNEKKEED